MEKLADQSWNQTGPGSRERWVLVLRHRERLLRIARRRLQNAHEAEDCTHEALLRCVTFERLDDRRVGEFLTTTVVRMCIDYRRHAMRMHKLRLSWHGPTVSRHPEEVASEVARGKRLLQGVARLPGRERQILLARANGLSTAQAATALGITLKAAEGAFTRGRARLRALCDLPM